MSRRPLARPKRFADQFDTSAPSHLSSTLPQPNSKKARTHFDTRNPSTLAADDSADEDAILELDEIGRKGPQTKRNAVELDGYETDSSQENFEARAEARADAARNGKVKGKSKGTAKASRDEDEADMFADLEEDFVDGDEEEDGAGEGGKKKKEVRFMEANEIEGQVASSKSGGHVSADFSLSSGKTGKEHESSSDEGDDELRDMMDADMDEEIGAGGKKKHAPKLDAFNMRNEQEEGRFDENGNFVRKAADPFSLHDQWLEGAVTKTDMKRAREAEEKREQERRKRDMEDDAVPSSALVGRLIVMLEHGETALEALQRLAAAKPKEKKKPKWQKNKKDEMEVDKEIVPDSTAEIKRKEAVEAITVAADGLLTRGQTDIYDQERAMLMRQYKRETGEDWIDKEEKEDDVDPSMGAAGIAKNWEYRWADGRDGGEHHGPYDGPTMTSWNAAGYFGEGVEFRQVGTDGWTRSVEF